MYIVSVDHVRPCRELGVEKKHALNKVTVREVVSFAREFQQSLASLWRDGNLLELSFRRRLPESGRM